MLGVDSAGGGGGGGPNTKLSPTNSLRCPRAVKGPAPQNSISVRDLFPAAYARSAGAKVEPPVNDLPATTTTSNHVPQATSPTGALPTVPPQIICNSPSNYSPLSSSNKSTAAGSPDR